MNNMDTRLQISKEQRLKIVNDALVKECEACGMELTGDETNAQLCVLINTH